MDYVNLPLILAGPQVRRAESTRVFFWLATSVAATIVVEVYAAGGRTVGTSNARDLCRIRLGERLFVNLVEARPLENGFPSDELLTYDVFVDGDGLDELGMLGTEGVALPEFDLPGFFIPGELATVYLGSCRKPHGGNPCGSGKTSDALAYACDLLERDARDLGRRPAVLLGMGDQIYADDVAGAMLEGLKPLARALIGQDEVLPGEGALADIPFAARQSVVNKHGFTTGHGAHHLLGLGEFAAMYICVLGGPMPSFPAWEEVAQDTKRQPAEREAAGLAYEGSARLLAVFLQGAKRVRRLMANVVSYNIFDDHEVTDDWNIDRPMYRCFERDPFARRVVANALIGYWAFQGWGNDPDRFLGGWLERLQQALLDNDGDRDALYDEFLTSYPWHYVAPTQPPLIFLDARTRRKFGSGCLSLHLAELLDKQALEELTQVLRHTRTDKEFPAYIVAPTPVMGFLPVEFLQGTIKKILTVLRKRTAAIDCESWITVREGYFHLMQALLEANVTNVVFLSGDVHYGFVKSGVFEFGRQPVSVLQITSSALHNYPPSAPTLRWMSMVDEITERRAGFVGTGFVQKLLRWFRPWIIDLPVLAGWYRPETGKRDVWFDLARLCPISDRDSRIVTDSHIAVLSLENGRPSRLNFRYPAEGNSLATVQVAFWAPTISAAETQERMT